MTVPIRFVVTVCGAGLEWECEVHDPKVRPITWGDISRQMEKDKKCPLTRGQTLHIKSNWQKDASR